MTDTDRAREEKAIRRKAAAPNLCLGALYAVAGLWVFFKGRFDFGWLGSIMAIQVFAIHSFPFMMLIASYEPKTDFGKRAQKVAFWMMLSVYFLFALKEGGVSGVFAFAGLTVSTYLGYLLRRTSPDAVAELIARWAMSFFIFIGAGIASGIPGDIEKWSQSPKSPVLGMLYFTALGLLEWYGFYDLPKVREAAANVRSAFENSRRA